MIKKIISIKLRYDKYREKGKRENKMNYEKLLEPIKVGNHIWRNRIVMPACETRLSNPDGSSSREMATIMVKEQKVVQPLLLWKIPLSIIKKAVVL